MFISVLISLCLAYPQSNPVSIPIQQAPNGQLIGLDRNNRPVPVGPGASVIDDIGQSLGTGIGGTIGSFLGNLVGNDQDGILTAAGVTIGSSIAGAVTRAPDGTEIIARQQAIRNLQRQRGIVTNGQQQGVQGISGVGGENLQNSQIAINGGADDGQIPTIDLGNGELGQQIGRQNNAIDDSVPDVLA